MRDSLTLSFHIFNILLHLKPIAAKFYFLVPLLDRESVIGVQTFYLSDKNICNCFKMLAHRTLKPFLQTVKALGGLLLTKLLFYRLVWKHTYSSLIYVLLCYYPSSDLVHFREILYFLRCNVCTICFLRRL